MNNHPRSTTAEPRAPAADSASDHSPADHAADDGSPLSGDLLQDARAIAGYLGLPVRRVTYLLELGRLPAFRWAGRVCASTDSIVSAMKPAAL